MTSDTVLHNRYDILATLGQSALGVTYLAHDRHSGRRCVIKTANAAHPHAWKTIEMFEREANILSHLHHPRIPRYLDFFSLDNPEGSTASRTLYLVQEYVDGRNLAEWIQSGRHFTASEVLHIARETAAVLAYLHTFTPPLIHRDLKPSNILFTADQQVYVVDFGTVRDYIRQDDITSMGRATIVGTYGYMPFEQFEGRATPASDVYAFGLSLLYLLTHKEPDAFKKTGQRLEFAPYVSLSKKFVAVIAKMIAPDWTERYQTGADLQRALERLSATSWPWASTRWHAAMLIVALMACLVGAGVYMRKQRVVVPPEVVPKARSVPRPSSHQTSKVTSAPRAAESPPAAPSVTGRLWYDGQPITSISAVQPRFWFRNEDTGREHSARTVYTHGVFTVYNLPPGRFGVNVTLDTNLYNGPMYPGDFNRWQTFDVTAGALTELDVELLQIIHLISPQDNGVVMDKWGADCMDKITLRSPVTVRWEGLGPQVFYDYQVTRMNCLNHYNSAGIAASGTTSATQVVVDLPPSAANECYGLHLKARKDGRGVGMLTTHGANGLGWDYRFRVQ